MYRDILVHLKSYEGWSPHIDAAIALAARSGAQLTGLLTHQEIAIAKQLAPTLAAFEPLGELQAQADAKSAAMKKSFEAALAAAGAKGVFESAEGRANELLSLAGRFHDLIVVEQTDPSHDERNWETAEEAAVHSGRPCLIVPRLGRFVEPFKRVLVAWNGTRESTRALHAALPLIEAADSVVLLEGRMREGMPSVTRLPSLEIGAYLQRHAKRLELGAEAVADADASDAILKVAAAKHCDLIVMGAYGRSGLARLILGGATGEVFAKTTVPILAAH